jgi:hypothetical protein
VRKLFSFMMTTLDGYYEGRDQEFDWPNVDDSFLHVHCEIRSRRAIVAVDSPEATCRTTSRSRSVSSKASATSGAMSRCGRLTEPPS